MRKLRLEAPSARPNKGCTAAAARVSPSVLTLLPWKAGSREPAPGPCGEPGARPCKHSGAQPPETLPGCCGGHHCRCPQRPTPSPLRLPCTPTRPAAPQPDASLPRVSAAASRTLCSRRPLPTTPSTLRIRAASWRPFPSSPPANPPQKL